MGFGLPAGKLRAMAKYTHPVKMSDRRRCLHYAWRKATWLGGLAAAVALAILADRLGVLGGRPPDDLEKYHDKTCHVVRVIDGDTLDVDIPDRRRPHTRVRLWGVDTPETVKPNTPPQHFGRQAGEFTKRICLDKEARLELERPKTRDNYGRLLAYVYLPDGRMLNRLLVTEGYGYADPRYDHAHKREFRSLQRAARRAGVGLWRNLGRSDLPYYYQGLKLPERSRGEEQEDETDTRPSG